MSDIETAGDWVKYMCAFCGRATDDDPQYVHLTVDWAYTGESQAMGGHGSCLRAAINPHTPLLGG